MKKNRHTLKANIRFNKIALFATALGLSIIGYFLVRYTLAGSASLSLAPSSQSAAQGSELAVAIRVDTGGAAINVVQANLAYPADKLQFSSIDSSQSAFNSSAEATGGGGSIRVGRYAGGSHASVSGDLLVATVYFKVLAGSGSAAVTFANGSAAYSATDSTDILTFKNGGLYNLVSAATAAAPITQNPPRGTSTPPAAPATNPATQPSSGLPARTTPISQPPASPNNSDTVPYEQTGPGAAFPAPTALKSSTAPSVAILIGGWLLFLLAAAAVIYKIFKVVTSRPDHAVAINAPLPSLIYPSTATTPAAIATPTNLPVLPPLPAVTPSIIKFRQHSYLQQKPVAIIVMLGLSLTGILLVVAGRAASQPPVRCQPAQTHISSNARYPKPCTTPVSTPVR